MSEYQLELKQIVDYPRCRIYRQFIRQLMADRNLRAGGNSGLFYYTVLCSYANFRTSYKRVDGISYTVHPGEWLCKVSEISEWFRVRFHHQALSILQSLQDKHLITYNLFGHGKLIKFRIINWEKNNRILDYNAPCQKDTGFFFLSISFANELISSGKCSELDAVLDLWINAVYNDKQVQGSAFAPVVYLRNGTGSPLTGYAELAERWGISKSTAGRYIKKLEYLGYIALISFPGTYGSAIYLQEYLSTMFQISDVMVDKDEVAMALNIKVEVPECIDSEEIETVIMGKTDANSGSNNLYCVSKSHMDVILQNVDKILSAQGFSCFSCPQIRYKLLPLSPDCRDDSFIYAKNTDMQKKHRFMLIVSCKDTGIFKFDIELRLEVLK